MIKLRNYLNKVDKEFKKPDKNHSVDVADFKKPIIKHFKRWDKEKSNFKNYLNSVQDIKQVCVNNNGSLQKLEILKNTANNHTEDLHNIETFLLEKPVERKKIICHIRNPSNTKR